jgi:hypothetical protein
MTQITASGFTWNAGDPSNPDDGHCVVALGYTAEGLIVSTWGMLGTMTWAAAAQYLTPDAGGSCMALVTQDWIVKATQDAPMGISWSQLVNDLEAEGGTVAA